MITLIISSFILLSGFMLHPAETDTISLSDCYEVAYENYPTADKIELQKRITDLNVRIAHSGYYPEVQLSGKASYQSEVPEFQFPGGGASVISKDQYEAAVNVNQSVYNGGVNGIRKDLEKARGEQEINNTKVELHQIRKQVDQVYFGILLSRQQEKSSELLMQNLKEQLKTVRSRVENGVLLPSQQHILQAELLRAEQDSVSIQSNIKAGYRVLSEITGTHIDPHTTLRLPAIEADYREVQPRRPEYDLFGSSRDLLEQQKKLNSTQKLPGISAFGTAAYGRPGLNFLEDDFHSYYMVGVRLRWNIRDAFNANRKNETLHISRQKIIRDEQAFTKQLNVTLNRIDERIASILENIDRDEKIITLREKVVQESGSQLKNGVITATEYVTELNRTNQARLSLLMNKIRLAQARAEYLTALGVDPE